ncbi:hypothetical protein VPH35_124135 [Triticum aestivum]
MAYLPLPRFLHCISIGPSSTPSSSPRPRPPHRAPMDLPPLLKGCPLMTDSWCCQPDPRGDPGVLMPCTQPPPRPTTRATRRCSRLRENHPRGQGAERRAGDGATTPGRHHGRDCRL